MHGSALTASHLNTTDDAAGDGQSGQAVALVIHGIARVGYHEEAGDRRQHTTQHIGRPHRSGYADASEGGGLRIIAHYMQAVAKPGLVHPQEHQHDQHQENDGRRRKPPHPADLGLGDETNGIRILRLEGALGKQEHKALERIVGGDGGNQRGYADLGHYKAVDKASNSTAYQRGQDAQHQSQNGVGAVVHRIEHDDGYHTGGSRLEAHRQIDVARDHHQAQAQTHRAVHGHVIDDVVEAFAVIGNEDKCRHQDQNQDQDGVIVLEQPDLLLSAQVAGDHHFLFHSLTPLSLSTSRDKTTSMMAPMMTHWRYWDILSAVKPADNTP